ncbi:MAG TPA: hypothetical protein VE052_00310 [Gemmatimonadaceae bacterium]|jgi:hypothetical protein|nr:hypothetical protein [Gemmatimonadaceae bacterium]
MKRFAVLILGAALGCVPSAAPLKGVLAPDRSLPALSLPSGHRHLVFKWDYQEGDIAARGDGSVRTAAPDSARLDFFLGGGLGAGAAVLIRDSLRSPHAELARRYIPPSPMMWAALGRLAIPPLPDTVVRIDGDLLRADVGHPAQWRVTIRGDTLVALEHISGGKITESIARGADGVLTYRAPGARRRLDLTILRDEPGSFDASIWSL